MTLAAAAAAKAQLITFVAAMVTVSRARDSSVESQLLRNQSTLVIGYYDTFVCMFHPFPM